jgi:uncharacterized protein (TIGR02145 family)
MKKIIMLLVIVLAYGSINAQDLSVKFNMNDGSVKYYKIQDIKNMEFQNAGENTLMKLYVNNGESFYYPVVSIDKMELTKDSMDTDILSIIVYGSDRRFPVADIDSIVFFVFEPMESVTIGTQMWTAKNLDVTTYRNGDPIPQVMDATEWANLTTGAWCYYNNDESNNATYGKLYNWYAVNDPRGLTPAGWHVPTDAEWKTLEMELGMTQAEADAIGFRGTDEGSQLAGNAGLWTDGALETNANFGASGFAGLPGGWRSFSDAFYGMGSHAYWWSSSESSASNARYRYLYYNNSGVNRIYTDKKTGFAVRCVRD